ncbi:hypothetical protein ILUMI_04788 [Ignelater luminosus]|uniref:PiggyBac transposable element-derived protein domain-containing protein n=1 Tax=Ignelater luminosus TaxID=2038154 RepID=A0A8K0DD69_IGNLU|nr:hypothetical protein ILUMI_04788 [Ignelater luminosus]
MFELFFTEDVVSLLVTESHKIKTDYQNMFGKAAAPFVTMLDEFPDYKRNLEYYLYFDNLFSSFHLLNYLRDFGYRARGTIRDNRISKNYPLLSKTSMKKKPRGEYDYLSVAVDQIRHSTFRRGEKTFTSPKEEYPDFETVACFKVQFVHERNNTRSLFTGNLDKQLAKFCEDFTNSISLDKTTAHRLSRLAEN